MQQTKCNTEVCNKVAIMLRRCTQRKSLIIGSLLTEVNHQSQWQSTGAKQRIPSVANL